MYISASPSKSPCSLVMCLDIQQAWFLCERCPPCYVTADTRLLVFVQGESRGSGQSNCAEAGALLSEGHGRSERAGGPEAACAQGLSLHAAAPLLRQHHQSCPGKPGRTSQEYRLACASA